MKHPNASRFCALAATILAIAVAIPAQQRDRRMELGSSTAGGPRIALVIGNAAYDTSPLKNPTNDAADVAAALRALGFDVTLGQNWTKRQMEDAIYAFGQRLKAGGVGLFYYSGHGMQVAGRNYLIPIGCRVEDERDVEFEAVDANRVLAKMDAAGNGLNLMILDACRNNPFARSFRSETQGLAQMDAPVGTYIAYATAPGSVAADGEGRNGTYTAALLKEMRKPGLKVEEVFKQVRADVSRATGGKQLPWDASSLVGDFFFIVPAAARATAGGPAAPGPSAAAIESEYWNTIKDSTDAADFEAYLKEYPSGTYASLARLKVQKLRAVARPEPAGGGPPPRPEPAARPGGDTAVDLGSGVRIELVYVRAGSFDMGSAAPRSGEDWTIAEVPQHRVTISKPFLMGKYEVTQGQWKAVMGSNPSKFSGNDDLPVEQVSWEDCQEFIRRLNAKTGGGWRLPTEAEWEYACRAGTSGDYAGALDQMAWYDGNSGGTTHPVGQKQPNAWGLYDMHGNVWEWCQDWYDASFYGRSPGTDPVGPSSGSNRVDRGSCWGNTAAFCRSATRDGNAPSTRSVYLGFRLARTSE
jgi:formylglycine-generating enzyme required for sulfatase activity